MAYDRRWINDTQFAEKYTIIGTSIHHYQAWEIDRSRLLDTPFRAFSHLANGDRVGMIGSDSSERAEEARSIILKVFPEVVSGTWDASMKEFVTHG